MNKPPQPLVPLAHAHITQLTENNVKTPWIIKENKTGRKLGELPSKLNEAEVFQIFDIMKKYELEALNIGIQEGKKIQEMVYAPHIAQLKNNLLIATNENERIAEALDNLTQN